MRLFSIGETSNPYPEDQTWLAVWAVDQASAVVRFNEHWQKEGGWWLDEDDVKKLRIDDVTEKSGEKPPYESQVENRITVHRRIGWWCDGDEKCESCDLAEMDGKFSVCEDCRNCEECGCDCEVDN